MTRRPPFEASQLQENEGKQGSPAEHLLGKERSGKRANEAEARELFGKRFFGPQEVADVFGKDALPLALPMIPFTVAELTKASKKGSELVLFISDLVDKEKPGKLHPITISSIQQYLQQGAGVLVSDNALGGLQFTEQPRAGWRLIDATAFGRGMDYRAQMQHIANTLPSFFDTPEHMPERYVLALEEFEASSSKLANMDAKQLAGLSLNGVLRERAVEVVYRTLLHQKAGTSMFQDTDMIWTNSAAGESNIMVVSPMHQDKIVTRITALNPNTFNSNLVTHISLGSGHVG